MHVHLHCNWFLSVIYSWNWNRRYVLISIKIWVVILLQICYVKHQFAFSGIKDVTAEDSCGDKECMLRLIVTTASACVCWAGFTRTNRWFFIIHSECYALD